MEIVFAADPPARLSRRNFGLVFPLDVISIAIVGDGYMLGRGGVVIPWMDESGVFFFSLLFFSIEISKIVITRVLLNA